MHTVGCELLPMISYINSSSDTECFNLQNALVNGVKAMFSAFVFLRCDQVDRTAICRCMRTRYGGAYPAAT